MAKNKHTATQDENVPTVEAKIDAPEKPREWDEKPSEEWPGNLVGSKVFTPKGTGHVEAVDWEAERAKVVLADDTEVDVPANACRTSAVDKEARAKYIANKAIRTPGGAPTIGNGDEVQRALAGLDLDQLAAVAKENGLSMKWEGWSHLNAGMRRMNLGNALRNLLKKDQDVEVLGHEVAIAAHMREQEAADKAAQKAKEEAEAKATKEAAEAKAKQAASAAKKADKKAA